MIFALQLSDLALWLFATAALAVNKIGFHAATYPPTPFKIKLAQKRGVKLVDKPGLLISGILNTPDIYSSCWKSNHYFGGTSSGVIPGTALDMHWGFFAIFTTIRE